MSVDEIIENLLFSYANLEQKRSKLVDSLGKLQGLSSVKKKELKEVKRAVNEEKKNVLRELRGNINIRFWFVILCRDHIEVGFSARR